MSELNIIVKRIEELRLKTGYTKRDLAKAMGTPASTFNNWYYSDTVPSLGNIENICKALNITVEQFFTGIGKTNTEGEKFLQEWRMLSDEEKSAINGVISAFKKLRKRNEQ